MDSWAFCFLLHLKEDACSLSVLVVSRKQSRTREAVAVIGVQADMLLAISFLFSSLYLDDTIRSCTI